MKRLIFSIVSVLQFAALASSCKKCVTCTIYYYTNSVNSSIYTGPKYCGTNAEIKAYEKGFKDLEPALPGDSVQVNCAKL